MLPDPGCYEERYRLTAGAAGGLAAGLVSLGLVFLTVAPWVTGVVIALALLALLGPGVAARRMIAFRADYEGITLGAAPGKLMGRRDRAVFIPWADAEKIILYPADPGARDPADQVPCIGVQRREGSPALPVGNEQASGCPVPRVAAGAARKVTGWRLDRERLAAVTAAVAPGIPIVEAGAGPSLGVEGPSPEASAPEPGPAG
jgi:hypothetical protein